MLKSFTDPDEWLTSTELSRRAKLSPASGHRLLVTLEEVGAVVRDRQGRYRPGMLLVSLSKNVIVSDLFHEAGRRVAEDLSKRLDATVHIGVLEGGMVTYAIKASTPASFETETRAGAQLEAYCSGLGKVLLAELSPERLDRIIFDGDLVALTENTITDKEALRMHLSQVKEQGFAIDNCEFRSDMYCVAVPIRDYQDRAVAAISITEGAEDASRKRQDHLREELLGAALAISQRIRASDAAAAIATRCSD